MTLASRSFVAILDLKIKLTSFMGILLKQAIFCVQTCLDWLIENLYHLPCLEVPHIYTYNKIGARKKHENK
jgi:hypothetical protein